MKHYLDVVIDSIDPNLIIEQMQNILRFLQSNQKQLCFINITSNMEKLLLNIVITKENLAYDKLVIISNGLSNVIYSVLDTTRNIFALVTEYETGKLNKKVLCYKKLFHNESSESMILQRNGTQQNSLQPLMAWIETNNMCQVDRCTLIQKAPKKKKNKNAQKKIQHEAITQVDSDMTNLRVAVLTDPYKYLSIEQTEEIKTALERNLEALIFSQPPRGGIIPPAFRGRPLLNKGVLRLWCEDDEALEWLKTQILDIKSPIPGTTLTVKRLSEIPMFSTKLLTNLLPRNQNAQSEEVKVQSKPDELSQLFKKVSMQTILDFINDKQRATVVFQQKTKVEARFLLSITKKSKSNANDHNIPENCKPLLMKIGAALKKNTDFNLSSMEGKLDKKTAFRDVTFMKIPNFSKDSVAYSKDTKTKGTRSRSATNAVKVKTAHSTNALSRTLNNDVPDLSTLSITDSKKPNKFEDNNWNHVVPKMVQSNISRARSLSQRRKLSANRINFQPTSSKETIPVIEKQDDATDNNRGRSRERKLDGRTSKLLADMSTPMKSDKAMRMMKGMGWDGGALGTRGDGITEPIIPELGIPRKAGLGHTVPQKPLPKQPSNPPPKLQTPPPQQQPPSIYDTNFPNSIYEILFEFITNNILEKQIYYKTPLTKKAIKFLRRTVQALNERGNVKTRIICDELYTLLTRIKEKIHIAPNLRLQVDISSDYTQVTFRKVSKQKKVKNIETVDLTGYVSTQLFLQTMETLPKMILKLIKGEDAEMSVLFDKILTKKQCEFIDNVVNWINRKSGNLSNTGSIFGKAIYSEIKGCMDNIELFTKFEEKSFILIKTYTDNRLCEAIDNNNTNTDNDIFDTDIVMISDDESVKNDVISNEEDILPIKSDTKLVETVVINAETEIEPVANPDEFYEFLRDLEVLFENDASDKEDKKEIKEESSWENLEDKDFSYNNTTSDLGTEVSPFSKRSLPDSDSDIPIVKKVKLEHYKRVCITPKNPDEVLKREKIKEIQHSICDAIDNAVHLIKLNCHGFINGALIYDSYDEQTFVFLKNIIDADSDLSFVERNEDLLGSCKMAIKINSFIDVNVEKMFSKIELYNPGLWTDDWVFIKKSPVVSEIRPIRGKRPWAPATAYHQADPGMSSSAARPEKKKRI